MFISHFSYTKKTATTKKMRGGYFPSGPLSNFGLKTKS